MTLDCTYTYHCSIAGCDQNATQHSEGVAKTAMPVPEAPTGWHEFGTLLICPLHSVMIDGEPAPPA